MLQSLRRTSNIAKTHSAFSALLPNPSRPEDETSPQSLPAIAPRRRGISRAKERLLITASEKNEITKKLAGMTRPVCAIA
jgi:hypothetical protein